MKICNFSILDQKIVIKLHNRVCETPEEVMESELLREIIKRAVNKLIKRDSYLISFFGKKDIGSDDIKALQDTLGFLVKMPAELVPNLVPEAKEFLKCPDLFGEFIEYLYNFWRSFDRFIVSDSTGKDWDKRPYRTFNSTIGQLTNLIRGIYRDIQENVSGKHPRIYRQVTAGAEVSTIAIAKNIPFTDKEYEKLNQVPVIRQILLYPPLILNPPMNKRTGKFEKINSNPLCEVKIYPKEWLCYPAKVGHLVILVYFNIKFFELGHSLANLFQLAEDEDLTKTPDAVYFFGVPGKSLDKLGKNPTVFFDDTVNNILVAAVPDRNEFGYFGYLKKMILTLHNAIMMKRGLLPFHGALVELSLKGSKPKTLLLIGDTGAGKSETLEALREIGEEDLISDMIIIADDMGSLEISKNGDITGYGTEIGAFLRMDDLKPGYAFGQMDRAIIMNPSQVNARIVMPITTFENVIKGYKIDLILYANNYEDIDEDHPIIERFHSSEKALQVFREGTVMSKGTTTSTGIVHSYFANIFGPPQYKDLHEELAEKFFTTFFLNNLFVGQMRTRLGIPGWERKGPFDAAKELLDLLSR